VGKAVCKIAAENSIALRALARKVPYDDGAEVEWVEGDLANETALAKLAGGASAIIHIAGLTNTPDTAQFDAVNVQGTANVIAAAKAADIKRLIFVSSLSARKPELSQYGDSKARAEELVKASGLNWTIVRPPAVYGPHDIDMFELFRTAKWGFVPLPPSGATSIIHVDDLARLLLGITPSVPSVNKHIFEPDDGREGGWSHKELGLAIGQALGRRVFAPNLPKAVLEAAARMDRLLRGKNAKLTQDRVGYMCHPNWVARFDRQVPAEIWQPRLVDEEGLRATAQWYRDNRWL
jgi:nucleoside-diphosphate-sugar epimerase